MTQDYRAGHQRASRWSDKSRHERGYGSAWTKLRASVLAEEPLCRECLKQGRTTAATHVDHITPKAKGGTDERTNLQPLCKPHHDEKTLHEAAEGQGRTLKPRLTYGLDGWPIG